MDLCKLSDDVMIPITTWNNQRVVTYDDIAKVHNVEKNTIMKAFSRQKKELFEGKDYFSLNHDEALKYKASLLDDGLSLSDDERRTPSIKLFTESGYLILACTFRGEKAAMVRRTLVNTYFKHRALMNISEDKIRQALNSYHSDLTQLKKDLVVVKAGVEMIPTLQKQFEETRKDIYVNNRVCNELIKRFNSSFKVSSDNWRSAAKESVATAVSKYHLNGKDAYPQLYNEMYHELEKNTGVRLKVRLAHAKKKDSSIKTQLDVIAADKKLIAAFVPIIGRFIMRYKLDVSFDSSKYEAEAKKTEKEAV